MTDHFLLHALPAGIGDCLVLDYGTADASARVVIDGGLRGTGPALAEFLGPAPAIELLVVTHVDNDHIQGALRVLEEGLTHPTLGDVWFNGYRHLPGSRLQTMGPVEGERLTTHLVDHHLPWNASEPFGGGAVANAVPSSPPEAVLPGGLACTVLAPGLDQLRALRPEWGRAVREAGLDPGTPLRTEDPAQSSGTLERMGPEAPPDVAALARDRSSDDTTEANGSSIVVLARWAGLSVLLAGDTHPQLLLAALDAWLGPGGVLDVDVFKLPHHGSKANVTSALLERVRARCYVFSTSGAGRSKHPDDQAVARVIAHSSGSRILAFNYDTPRNRRWDAAALKKRHGYRTRYPGAGHGGLTLDLTTL